MAAAGGEVVNRYLVDTNVLLRSAQPGAPEYPTAVAAVANLGEGGARLCVTPQNIIEFWGVATRPLEVNGLGMIPAEAEAELQRLEGFFALLPDVPEIYPEWRHLALTIGVSGRQVHDARLVAVMRAHGITHILTFNPSDFTRYPGITVLHPQDVLPPPLAGETDAEPGPAPNTRPDA